MKRYFALTVLLSSICAAQNMPSATAPIYDSFKGPFLNSSKWLTLPTCTTTPFSDTTASVNPLDCARDIQSNKLHLMVKAYGDTLSDVGRQLGPSELFFVNPNAINGITATLGVKRAEAVACPANPTPFSSMAQTIFGGNFFNPGTGDPRDDVAAILLVTRDPTIPVLLVQALVYSPNAFYGFSSLGTISFEQSLTGTLQWDQPNHQFIFEASGPNLSSTATISYSVSDTTPAAAPLKLIGARAFAPNCTTLQGTSDIEAFYDNVRVN
jgi:hypothetical protein